MANIMNITLSVGSKLALPGFIRSFSVSTCNFKDYSCKLLIVGGGTGGCTIASKFARKLKKDEIIVLEPATVHYYQPLFTLVGAGATPIEKTRRPQAGCLPSNATWLKDEALSINPKSNSLTTKEGHVINYEYLVVAVGLKNDYKKVPGLLEALEDVNNPVSTIYDWKYAPKVFKNLQQFESGEAIFTYPNSPIKCPGAPQKIAYLADSYLTKTNKRSKAKISYNTCLPVIFGVKKYANSLLQVAQRKNINVNYQTVLKEIHPDSREAVFFNSETEQEVRSKYGLLHVTPPQATPPLLQNSPELTDAAGYLDVDKYSLQHKRHPNIYGIGDCTNTPNSKTAAAIAKQCYVLEKNLLATMAKGVPSEKYNGYGACPLLTSYNTCIMAEFLYDGEVRETFPWDQSKESKIAFYMKKELFPFIYWHFMLKGYYHGPEMVRKIVNPLGWN